MTTSVPNFNFLAALILEIWWGPKIKIGGADLPNRPLIIIIIIIIKRQFVRRRNMALVITRAPNNVR